MTEVTQTAIEMDLFGSRESEGFEVSQDAWVWNLEANQRQRYHKEKERDSQQFFFRFFLSVGQKRTNR